MKTAEIWKQTIGEALDSGNTFTDQNNRTCIELSNHKIVFPDLNDIDFPLNQLHKLTEFNYPGKTELETIVFNPKGGFKNFAHRMLDYNGLNQLDDFIIPLLREEPNSRRAYVSTYNPKIDSKISQKSIISLNSLYFRIINNTLHLSIFIRSLDLFLGLPANLIQANAIITYVAKALKLPAASITFFAGSAHIFEDQLENMKKLRVL